MGNRRMGLGRMEKLLESVDRELNLENSTLLNCTITTNETCTFSGTTKLTGNTGLTRGSGFSEAETYQSWCEHFGGIIKTSILIDLTGVIGAGGALDIIGNVGAASAHIGQVTAAVCGAVFAGRLTCLELPAGGEPDIDLYASNVATGTENIIITDGALGTETALVTSGADMIAGGIAGTFGGFTAMPTANDYLYLVKGLATDTAEYTSGKLLIEMWGTVQQITLIEQYQTPFLRIGGFFIDKPSIMCYIKVNRNTRRKDVRTNSY